MKGLITLSLEETEKLFTVLDESAEMLEAALETSYLDALIETGENLQTNQVQVENHQPDEATVVKLTTLYQTVNVKAMDAETIRQAVQMAFLKATKEDDIQANHQMTPDSIGLIVGYLAAAATEGTKQVTVVDPVVGTGNLLSVVVEQLKHASEQVTAIGIDNDDSELAVAGFSAGLQQLPVDFYHQDALDDWAVHDADLVVADLPVGFYPLDERVVNFATKATEGHSYVHHLLLEQSMTAVKPGGLGLFLVPTQLFSTNEAKGLLKWMQSHAYMQALLNFPKSLFANANAQKSLLVLQRPGEGAKQVNKVMLGEFPSFKDNAPFTKFLNELVSWTKSNIKIEN